MAYADDLLQLAREIARVHPDESHQPSLRRALSTAYYALFHLLVSDGVASCSDPRLRAVPSRMFDHGAMRQVSDNQRPPEGPDFEVKEHLYNVATTFSEAHYNRNEADYNLVREWQPTEVSLLVESVEDASEAGASSGSSRWLAII